MRRELSDGYELDDDRARIDVDAVHEVITASYWATGRPRETMARLIDGAARVVGLYRGDAQVGFCRVESDGEKFAFLFDVYVLPEHRGRGLGVELVREAVERGPQADLAWYLKTRDAHGLYERFGFGPPDPERTMERPPPGRTERAARPPE
jgi:GNAT superfamily N-acetyltransferase